MSYEKVYGCLLGVAIGDALGKPVECYTSEQIANQFGKVTDYLACSNHKYFQDDDAATTTDDWQLTKAVSKAFIAKKDFDLDEIAKQHCDEYLISVRGWGKSTKESIGRIVAGTSRLECAITESKNRGLGNGVCMKAAPLGLWFASKIEDIEFRQHFIVHSLRKLGLVNYKSFFEFATMTHLSDIAVHSGISQACAVLYCMKNTVNSFDSESFIRFLINEIRDVENFESKLPKILSEDEKNSYFKNAFDNYSVINDRMIKRLELLRNRSDFSLESITKDFGDGGCYVYDSLPFSYAWFLSNPKSIESLYSCVNAGGDTDTNASMVGALLGALHGPDVFPNHLVKGLKAKEEVEKIAQDFHKTFFQ